MEQEIADKRFSPENIKIAKEQAVKIVNLCDADQLQYPEDGHTFTADNTIVAYCRVRTLASYFSNINQYCEKNGVERIDFVSKAMLEILYFAEEGVVGIAERWNIELQEVRIKGTDMTTLVEEGLTRCRDHFPAPYVFFFILALDRLAGFVDAFNLSYRTEVQLLDKDQCIESHKYGVFALGELLSAQIALEKGLYFMAVTEGAEAIKRIREIESKHQKERISPREAGKKGGDARAVKWQQVKGHALNLALEREWPSKAACVRSIVGDVKQFAVSLGVPMTDRASQTISNDWLKGVELKISKSKK